MRAKSLHSCPTHCDPIDCSPPGSSVHGIVQARILEWVAVPCPGDLPNPGIEPKSLRPLVSAGTFFKSSTTWEVPGRSHVSPKCVDTPKAPTQSTAGKTLALEWGSCGLKIHCPHFLDV